ncbi:wall-associated receptor kinase 2-like [Phoenix dactylifera]|uniref:Wall-associated receptor kinase 2-like n=1 Tax=Phoenix dactylifera TaxID=42345 RepID=A0A8B9A012_PHODC|nr:wall-associated receptor kinase 2-like [Phoenix dactylifera]
MISELLLILELLLLLVAASLGTYTSGAENSSSPLTCTSVPYPFGISGKALKGFEISCNGNSPILHLGKHTYEIETISLLQGNLIIYASAIARGCEGNFIRGSGWINLEGTPYTISDTQNMLTMVGCDDLAIIKGSRSNLTSGCVTFCDSVHSVVMSGRCSGLGCCQASIPKGLKSFNLTFGKPGNLINAVFNSTAGSQAFLVNQNSFTFSSEKLWGGVYHNQTFQVVLDWAIGKEQKSEKEEGNLRLQGEQLLSRFN